MKVLTIALHYTAASVFRTSDSESLTRFVIPLVHFGVTQLDLHHPDHSAIQADEAMLILDSGSVPLSPLARA